VEGAITSAGPRSDPRDSLDDAFRAHRPWLVRRLALVVRDVDEAEDLAQQAFLRAAQHWPFPPEQDVARWLAVVGLRLAIDERRRRKRWRCWGDPNTWAKWSSKPEHSISGDAVGVTLNRPLKENEGAVG